MRLESGDAFFVERDSLDVSGTRNGRSDSVVCALGLATALEHAGVR